jgi:hypothetical protein
MLSSSEGRLRQCYPTTKQNANHHERQISQAPRKPQKKKKKKQLSQDKQFPHVEQHQVLHAKTLVISNC